MELIAKKEKFVYFIFTYNNLISKKKQKKKEKKQKKKEKKKENQEKKVELKIYFPNEEVKTKFHQIFPYDSSLVFLDKVNYELDGFSW